MRLFPSVELEGDRRGEGGASAAAVLAERELELDRVVDEPLHGGLHLAVQVGVELERKGGNNSDTPDSICRIPSLSCNSLYRVCVIQCNS